MNLNPLEENRATVPRKKKYPLQSLVNLARNAVDKARKDLAASEDETRKRQAQLERRKQKLDLRARRVDESIHRMRDPVEGRPLNANELAAQRANLDRLQNELRSAKDLRDASEQELEAAQASETTARNLLAEKHRALETLAKHKDRWDRKAKKAAQKAEEEDQDEIAGLRFFRGKDHPGKRGAGPEDRG